MQSCSAPNAANPSPLAERVERHWPAAAWTGVRTLVAVSGGPDSVALLRVLHEIAASRDSAGRLAAVHVNHHLRGAASDEDQEFVVELCRQLGVELVLRSDERSAGPERAGSEARLREARYHFFEHAAREIGARYLATGHTLDDQAETVLFRALRGTGIAGLAGIRFERRLSDWLTLVRPLLHVTRAQLGEYLQQLGQSFRLDASNASGDYARNRLRHSVLPLLRELFPWPIEQSLARLAASAADATAWIDEQIGTVAPQIATIGEGGCEIDPSAAGRFPSFVVESVLRRLWAELGWPAGGMSRRGWQRLARAVSAVPGHVPYEVQVSGGITARFDGRQWRLVCNRNL